MSSNESHVLVHEWDLKSRVGVEHGCVRKIAAVHANWLHRAPVCCGGKRLRLFRAGQVSDVLEQCVEGLPFGTVQVSLVPRPSVPRPVGKLKWKEGLVNEHCSGLSRRMWGIHDICIN